MIIRSQVSAMDICILGRVLTGRRVKRSLHTPCVVCSVRNTNTSILTLAGVILSASISKFHQRLMGGYFIMYSNP